MWDRFDIEFRLHAQVNGQTFDMNGSGSGNRRDGTCTLDLAASPGFPEGFDPVSCPCICSHPTSSYFSKVMEEGADFPALTGHAYKVQPARVGIIVDPKGRELLRLKVTGSVRIEGDKLVSEHEMMGISHLPRLARNVTPFNDYFLPSRAGEATAVVRFKLLTVAGEELDGMTVVPYRWSGRELDAPLVRRVEDIQVEWDGQRRVVAHYRTAMRRLVLRDESALSIHLPSGMGDPEQLLEMAQLSPL